MGWVNRHRLIAPLAVAVVVRSLLAFVLLRSMPLVSDAAEYAKVAARLQHDFPGDFEYFWPPGTSYAIWAVWSVLGTGTTQARVLAVAIGVINVALVMAIARQVGADDRVVAVAGWVAALFPPAALLATQTYSHDLTTTCLLAAVSLALAGWHRSRWWLVALAGLPLGYGVLTRPPLLSVVVALLVLAVLTRARPVIVGAAAALALAVAVVAPVAAHNHAQGAGWTVSTNGERSVWLGNNRYTPLYKTSHLAQREPAELSPEVRAYVVGIESRTDARDVMVEETVDYVGDHPFETVIRTLNRVRAFWGYDYVLSREIQEAYGWSDATLLVPLAFEAGGYLLVAIAIIVGLVVGRSRLRRPELIVLVALALAYQLPYLFAFSVPSYHAPPVALLMPLAAAGTLEMWERRGAVLRHRWLLVALCLFAVAQVEFTLFAVRYR
jgi:4-amino-4-deoxy-L-arabinose transferase-like glycosyltransferase